MLLGSSLTSLLLYTLWFISGIQPVSFLQRAKSAFLHCNASSEEIDEN